MRAIALLTFLPLVACQTRRQFTLPNGATYADNGHLAGDTLVMMKPDGTVILRNKMNEPFGRLVEGVETVGGGLIYAGVEKAAAAGTNAVAISAQRQATSQGKTAAGLEALRIKEAAALEKFRLANPAP